MGQYLSYLFYNLNSQGIYNGECSSIYAISPTLVRKISKHQLTFQNETKILNAKFPITVAVKI